MKLKKWSTVLGAAALVASVTVPAMAIAKPLYHFETANVIVTGTSTLSKATKFVANKTTYMSVYDVQLLINKLTGTTNKSGDVWRGDLHYWNITHAKTTPKYISGSYGNTVFKINGQVIMNAPVIVTKPPGVKQVTSFVPIWYVQQVINELEHTNKYSDVWNGAVSPSKWTLTTINPGGLMIPATGSGSKTGSGQTATSSVGPQGQKGTETSKAGSASGGGAGWGS